MAARRTQLVGNPKEITAAHIQNIVLRRSIKHARILCSMFSLANISTVPRHWFPFSTSINCWLWSHVTGCIKAISWSSTFLTLLCSTMETIQLCGSTQMNKAESAALITSPISRLLLNFAMAHSIRNLLPCLKKYNFRLVQPTYGYGGPAGN